LQQLNKVNVEVLQADIKDIIADPEQYALDFAEIMFAKNMTRYIKAYKLGERFAKKNMKTESSING
tara:strand:+ start:325 stop:522 length:198 start_codon:yes stop_codon:yes gene_type:complete